MKTKIATVLLGFGICASAQMNKATLVSKYQKKFVLVLRDGLVMGVCPSSLPADPAVGLAMAGLTKLISPHEVGYTMAVSAEKGAMLDKFNLNHCGVEPIRKGEVLRIGYATEYRKEYLVVHVVNVSPHSVTVGVGAFAHQSLVTSDSGITFWAGKKSGLDAVEALVSSWFKLLDAADDAEALRIGNTASGVSVKQVTAGMSFAEVESALGVPETRIDLGEKVMYKYKDLTAEFHDGKVADVR
jgi:hypothetical protein